MKFKLLSIQDYKNIKQKMCDDIDEGSKTRVFSFVNPFSYYMVNDHSDLSSEVDGYFVDGVLLKHSLRLRDGINLSRVSFDFSSIAHDFISYCENNELVISFVGAKSNELEMAIRKLKEKYPKLKFGYCRDGYISGVELETEIDKLSTSDIIVVGMGAPHQEIFSLKIKDRLNGKFVFTCGGFLTQTSIREDYYYPIVKKLGLRWLQRIILHKHVREKVIKEYPYFLYRFFIKRD